jgi:hypothetical protein
MFTARSAIVASDMEDCSNHKVLREDGSVNPMSGTAAPVCCHNPNWTQIQELAVSGAGALAVP